MTEITLGDIHRALKDLVAQGAHPGSIQWVLQHQIEWPRDCEPGVEHLAWALAQAEIKRLRGRAQDVDQVNAVLDVNVWEVPSFRADVRIDFDEYGRVLATSLINKKEKA